MKRAWSLALCAVLAGCHVLLPYSAARDGKDGGVSVVDFWGAGLSDGVGSDGSRDAESVDVEDARPDGGAGGDGGSAIPDLPPPDVGVPDAPPPDGAVADAPLPDAGVPDGAATDGPPTDTGRGFSCAAVSQIPVSECMALVALHNGTNGANWTTSTHWLEANIPCAWHGVTCANGHVTQLNLQSNQLSGAIPPELGNLTSLRDLWLDINQLSGVIPPELGDLTSLETLRLSSNQLSGAIPPELGNLTSLRDLHLSSNQLSGAIPPALGSLTSVGSLSLGTNQLGGAIPPELGNLTNLKYLYLSSNQLSGTIPPRIFGAFPSIRWLILHNNLFDQAAVDAVVTQLFSARATYAYATPILRIQNNVSPSGTWTDPGITPGDGSSNSDWWWNGLCHEPQTGMARIYALENDNCGEAFNKWAISNDP